MTTCKELCDKYSTGVKHISPAAIEYPDGAFRSRYICKAPFGDILREYLDHLYLAPSSRCRQIPISHDGVIRTDILDVTGAELEWVSLEYILRESLNRFFGVGNFVEFIITIKEK